MTDNSPKISQRNAQPEPGAVTTAEFGTATLNDCENERIQFPNAIQPHGALLVLDEKTLTIQRWSENSQGYLELNSPPAGLALASISEDLCDAVSHSSDQDSNGLRDFPTAVRCKIGVNQTDFDCIIHAVSGHELVVELQRSDLGVSLSTGLEDAIRSILGASSIQSLCDISAQILKSLLGYHRVMIYRFDEDNHGEVLSERRESHLEPYLGNHYPASDIPQIARTLYLKTRIRVLADIDADNARINSIDGEDAAELDMSMCALRILSPIHLEYLRNMGVKATMVSSLVSSERLWGLVSCHHQSPRVMSFEARALTELLSEVIATRIAAIESKMQTRAEYGVRMLEQQIAEVVSRDGSWTDALFNQARSILNPLDSIGAVLLHDGQKYRSGSTLDDDSLGLIVSWLNQNHPNEIFSTQALQSLDPALRSVDSQIKGFMSVPVSQSGTEYLIWFRKEQIRTIVWGGNPDKAMVLDEDRNRLAPRQSFDKWHQVVRDTCAPWTFIERHVARLIGKSLSDIIAQFRVVRLLIAQTQLESITDEVRQSELAAIVVAADGHIVIQNRAFENLIWSGLPDLNHIADLPRLFQESTMTAHSLKCLFDDHKPWRGELTLDAKPVFVRADPVFAQHEVLLGFIMLFSDLGRQALPNDHMRQDTSDIVASLRKTVSKLDAVSDGVLESLLTLIVQNAELAKSQIYDSIDSNRTPEMLDSVDISLSRTTQLLERLVNITELAPGHPLRASALELETRH